MSTSMASKPAGRRTAAGMPYLPEDRETGRSDDRDGSQPPMMIGVLGVVMALALLGLNTGYAPAAVTGMLPRTGADETDFRTPWAEMQLGTIFSVLGEPVSPAVP